MVCWTGSRRSGLELIEIRQVGMDHTHGLLRPTFAGKLVLGLRGVSHRGVWCPHDRER